ncbi:MAG: 3-carboxy-cis,cis-muconate cycloisomerase [Caulobacteraceae bacterium]
MSSLIRERAAASAEMMAVFGDASLIRGALAFEAALARAGAAEGVIPIAHVPPIEAGCAEVFAPAALAEAAAHAGTLAIPLVAELRARIAQTDPEAAKSLHKGGTSQDLADTALMLQVKAGLALITRDGGALCEALATLARAHATTPMIGRTLLQAALPITFGLKAAQWLTGVAAALERLEHEADHGVCLQFGGATGSRAGLSGKGAAMSARMAAELGLNDPALPWQAQRQAVCGLGAALAILVGALGKIARDVSLLMQNEVAEAFEPKVAGRGGSSAMAHKRNPTSCQVVLSAAVRAPHLAATLMSALPAEHERGLGGWQAEGPALSDLFLLAHGALAALLPVIADLEIDAAAMAKNLDAAHVGHDPGEAQAMVRLALDDYAARKI